LCSLVLSISCAILAIVGGVIEEENAEEFEG
jgi:hypothetical protein